MQEMQEMWVWSLGCKASLEEEMAIYSNVLAGWIPWTESPWGHKELDATERLSTQEHIFFNPQTTW